MINVVFIFLNKFTFTVVPAKSDSDVLLCLQLLTNNNLYTPPDLM